MGPFIFILACIVSTRASGPEIIGVSSPWIVKYPEEAFNLVCKGTQPLSWDIHDIPREYVNITETQEYGKYISLLKIPKPYASDTGLFRCMYPSGESDSTYVYAYGDNDTFVLNPKDPIPVAAEINQNFTLDCRITHPDINVSVFHDRMNNNWSNLENVTEEFYKDDYGRFTKTAQTLQDSGRYICREDWFNNELQFYVSVRAPPSPLHTPSIKGHRNSYYVIGLPIDLNCSVPITDGSIQLDWSFPNPSGMHDITEILVEQRTTYMVSLLHIPSSSYEDSGSYTCTASKGRQTKTSSVNVKVKDSMHSFVQIDEPPKVLPISEGEDFRWIISVSVYPKKPLIVFSNSMGDTIESDERTSITFDYKSGQLCLKIQNVQASDFGKYTVKVTTTDGKASDSKSTVMYVMAKPTITFDSIQSIVDEGSPLNITAEILSFDKELKAPDISCEFIANCPEGLGSCRGSGNMVKTKERTHGIPKNKWYSDIFFYPVKPGKLTCTVTNDFGSSESHVYVIVKDYLFSNSTLSMVLWSEGGIDVVEPDSTLQFVEGDTIRLKCSAVKFTYENLQLDSTGDFRQDDCSTDLSHAICVSVENIDSNFSESFTCKALQRTGDPINQSFHMYTIEKRAPALVTSRSSVSTDGSELVNQLGDALDIACVVNGEPKPKISWFLDGENIEEMEDFIDNEAVVLRSDKQILSFKFLKRQYEGVYTCLAENREGTIEPYASVVVKGKALGTTALVFIALAAMLIVFLSLIVGCLIFRVKKERKFRNALRKNRLYLFEKGNIGDLNQDCMLDEQAELLPYDKSYEIDRERITIGKQLGCGAFGRVMLADLRPMGTDQRQGKVALKMGKDISDQSHLRALTAELKIMIHIGKHLNIVNLIGANTERLDKGDMWILVEYCKYGNLLRFIQKHKKSFVDQIDHESGVIDFQRTSPVPGDPLTPGVISYKGSSSSAETERLSPSFKLAQPSMFRKPPQQLQNSQQSDSSQRPGFYAGNPQYSHMGSVISKSETSLNMSNENSPDAEQQHSPSHDSNKRHNSTSSARSAVSADTGYLKNCNTDMTFLSSPLTSNTCPEDTQGSPIQWDCEIPGVNGHFSTAVLVCWAWQVACGMEYLAKRKVLHGDLAARNLLLAANNVVKISDFGLSKDIYKNDIYMKKDDGAMPIKWMSLEAIEQRLFSTQSDVWAYGVTLWELFTLGNTPYPGIAVDRDFVAQLEKGMRMSKPKYSNQELYDLMLKCWQEDPCKRPSFQSITGSLAELLYTETKEQYVAMNDVLEDSNKEWFETRPDYFNLLQTPDYANLQPNTDPGYMEAMDSHKIPVNEEGDPYTPIVGGYVPMHTINRSIASEPAQPITEQNRNIFFPDSPEKSIEASSLLQNTPPKTPITPSNNNVLPMKNIQEDTGLLSEPRVSNNTEGAPPYVRVGYA